MLDKAAEYVGSGTIMVWEANGDGSATMRFEKVEDVPLPIPPVVVPFGGFSLN